MSAALVGAVAVLPAIAFGASSTVHTYETAPNAATKMPRIDVSMNALNIITDQKRAAVIAEQIAAAKATEVKSASKMELDLLAVKAAPAWGAVASLTTPATATVVAGSAEASGAVLVPAAWVTVNPGKKKGTKAGPSDSHTSEAINPSPALHGLPPPPTVIPSPSIAAMAPVHLLTGITGSTAAPAPVTTRTAVVAASIIAAPAAAVTPRRGWERPS